jgi:tripartite-type tricarboxylate transporter receptor subunit TctC
VKKSIVSIIAGVILSTASFVSVARENIIIAWPFGPVAAHQPFKAMSENATSAQNEFGFIVDFKSGAGGSIAANFVLNNDNALLASTSSFYINPVMNGGYDVNKFKLIDTLCDLPMVVASKKYKSMADIPRDGTPITVGTSGVGTTTHLLVVALQQQIPGIVHVPFQGQAPAITALLGGHVDLTVSLPGDTLQQAEAGNLNILAVSGTTKLNNILTLESLGFANTDKIIVQYYLHARVDNAKADRVAELLRASLQKDNVKQILAKNSCIPRSTPVKDLEPTHRFLTKFWRDQVQAMPKTN